MGITSGLAEYLYRVILTGLDKIGSPGIANIKSSNRCGRDQPPPGVATWTRGNAVCLHQR